MYSKTYRLRRNKILFYKNLREKKRDEDRERDRMEGVREHKLVHGAHALCTKLQVNFRTPDLLKRSKTTGIHVI